VRSVQWVATEPGPAGTELEIPIPAPRGTAEYEEEALARRARGDFVEGLDDPATAPRLNLAPAPPPPPLSEAQLDEALRQRDAEIARLRAAIVERSANNSINIKVK
jgi:hypothetical protein